jgi:hypothetical protein
MSAASAPLNELAGTRAARFTGAERRRRRLGKLAALEDPPRHQPL